MISEPTIKTAKSTGKESRQLGDERDKEQPVPLSVAIKEDKQIKPITT